MATPPLSPDGRAYRDGLTALAACENGDAADQARAGLLRLRLHGLAACIPRDEVARATAEAAAAKLPLERIPRPGT